MHGILDGRAHRRGDPDAAPRRSHVVVMPTHEVSDARHLKYVEGLYSPDVACATCVSWIAAVMPRAMAMRQGLHEDHLQTQATARRPYVPEPFLTHFNSLSNTLSSGGAR